MIAKIWRNRIIVGDQNLSECPEKYKDVVISLLKEDVKNGVITQEEYDVIMQK